MSQLQAITHTLQDRAAQLAAEKGHRLNTWQNAKRKHGTGATRTLCAICGMGVLVVPKKWYGKTEVSALSGEVLFSNCVRMRGIH